MRQIDGFSLIIYNILMVRTIIKPITQEINLSIPAEYIGKEVEILVFPVTSSPQHLKVYKTTET